MLSRNAYTDPYIVAVGIKNPIDETRNEHRPTLKPINSILVCVFCFGTVFLIVFGFGDAIYIAALGMQYPIEKLRETKLGQNKRMKRRE